MTISTEIELLTPLRYNDRVTLTHQTTLMQILWIYFNEIIRLE